MIINVKLEGNRENGETYKATGQYDTDRNKLKIDQGSRWAPTVTKDDKGAAKWISKLREKLVADGTVDGKTGVFKTDYSLSATKGGTPITSAAGIICGAARKADGCWMTMDAPQKQLFDRLEELGIVKKSGKGNKRRWVEPEGRKSPSSVEGGDVDSIEESESAGLANESQGKDNVLGNQQVAEECKGFLHQNVIFYGVPGCGKSYYIQNLLKVKDDDGTVIDMPLSYYKRILFHPEYSYSDFVGQIRPVAEDGNITYPFVPGPFTKILKDAYLDQDHEYFLIIEEINRGNAPAIFGDLFQLLDRDGKGKSEYSIYNEDILDYVSREMIKNGNNAVQSIEIPANLTIFATMNTCDQNVFTLDTAFKRRWRMSRIENEFSEEQDTTWIIQCGDKKFSWKKFAEAVNDAILNNCNDGTAAEDKRLGSYFVKEEDTKDKKRFAEKVMMYLWDDVAKYDRSQLFDNKYRTLDEVIKGFASGENVFSPNCEGLKALYKEEDDSSAGTGAEAGAEAVIQVDETEKPETDANAPDERVEA